MVRFMTIHFHGRCPIGPSAPDLWCIAVTTQASFLYLVCDGSLYDDSLLRPLSDWTERSLLVVHRCRDSSVLSLLSLWRFALWRFTSTTLVRSDRALPTCGASLSQLKHPFSTQCTSSSFPMCVCFFFLHFSAVLLSWLWFFHPWHPSQRQKRRKNQNSWRYILSWCLLNHGLGLL